jgi:hypothetical protein
MYRPGTVTRPACAQVILLTGNQSLRLPKASRRPKRPLEFPFLGVWMDTIGIALIVGGMAFLCSGLIFLLPYERKLASTEDSFEESQEMIEYYLGEMRKKTK